MANEKAGAHTIMASPNGTAPVAQARPLSAARAGQSSIHKDDTQTHTLMILINERPGTVDRVVGLLRRRRANLQTLTIARTGQANVTRITAVTSDADVEVAHLVEQVRKVVDVKQAQVVSTEQMIERELALIKVQNDDQRSQEIVAIGQQCGAQIAEQTPETLTFEITGNAAQIEQLVERLQPFGIREMARTGVIVMPRETANEG